MRIVIFGRPGSGKSTFALKLHKKTGISLYHLDKFFYTNNWVERDYQEFLNIQENILQQEQWIIDGNSLKSLEMRWARATHVLYFNYPRWLCLWRLLKRIVHKDPAIQDRAAECGEIIRWRLIQYMWTFEYRKNNRLMHQIKDFRDRYPQVQFIEIRNDKDLKKVSHLLD